MTCMNISFVFTTTFGTMTSYVNPICPLTFPRAIQPPTAMIALEPWVKILRVHAPSTGEFTTPSIGDFLPVLDLPFTAREGVP